MYLIGCVIEKLYILLRNLDFVLGEDSPLKHSTQGFVNYL